MFKVEYYKGGDCIYIWLFTKRVDALKAYDAMINQSMENAQSKSATTGVVMHTLKSVFRLENNITETVMYEIEWKKQRSRGLIGYNGNDRVVLACFNAADGVVLGQ